MSYDSASQVGLYWDFENVHAAILDRQYGCGTYKTTRFTPQEEVIDIEGLVRYVQGHGTLAINRAFANWVSFTRYRYRLLHSAVELIQVFGAGPNAKNGADIKLCLDVMDDMARFPHLRTIVVVGGDSDYMPLSYKVKAAGRKLVGVGCQASTNEHWARSCHEFLFYEELHGLLQANATPPGAGANTAGGDAACAASRPVALSTPREAVTP